MKKSIYRLCLRTRFGVALSFLLVTAGYNHGLTHPEHVVYASNNPIHTAPDPGENHPRPTELTIGQGVQSEAVAPLFSVADAHVRGGNYSNQNYGQDTLLLVKKVADNPSYVRHSYLKFDIAELPTSFASVVLRLYVSRTDGTDQHSISLVPDSNWAEGTIKWNNKPAAAPQSLASWTTQEAGETVSIDLTTAIRDELAAGRSVVSFVLTASGDRYIGYASRQNSDAAKRPQLVAVAEAADPRIEAESLVAEGSEFPLVVDDSNASGGKVIINNFTTSFVTLPSISASGDGRYIFTIGYRNGSALRKSLIINGTTTKITLPNTRNQLSVYQQLIQLDTEAPNTIKLLTDFGDDQSGDYDYFALELAADGVPSAPVQDDEANLFGWTDANSYAGFAFYEYSLNRGNTWTDAPSNPINVGDQLYSVGQIQVRVKADPATGRLAGFPLSSTQAYTIEATPPPVTVLGATLWRLGKDDQSSAEFSGYGDQAVDSLAVPADWNARSDWSALPKGLQLDQNGTLIIKYALGEVPIHGVELSFRILDANKVIPQLNVFSNEALAGLIQIAGLEGSDVDLKFKETFRLYIPKEFLQEGDNRLRLSLDRGLFADESSDALNRFVWDHLTLKTLAEPAVEPTHGRFVHLGNDFRSNNSYIRARTAFLLTKWTGIAYSGNWIRTGFSNNVTANQAYLQSLKDLNFNSMTIGFGTNFLNDEAAAGTVSTKGVQSFEDFLNNYGNLLTAMVISNEPGLFNTAQASNVAVTELAVEKRATYAPHLKLVAPGWAYWPVNGTPSGWARNPDQRRPIDELCDLTNGHSYSGSGTQGIGGSLAETLRTYNDYDGDGFPKEMVMDETGGNEDVSAYAFDREMRCNIGYVDHIIYFSDSEPRYSLFDYPGDLDTFIPTDAIANPNKKEGQEPQLKTYRRLALAYATHGAPLTYEYVNREELVGKRAYFRAVNTATIGRTPVGGKSDKVLVNFTNFDTEPLTMQVRVVMPEGSQYVGDRFGAGSSYDASHSRVSLSPDGDNRLVITETLGAGEAVQYILSEQESSAPSAPSELVATTQDFTRINIDWEPSEDNVAVAGYNIYRDDRLINIVPAAVTLYSDQNLSENATHTYTIEAFDDAGNLSARSEPAVATTSTIPITPGGPKYEAEDCIPAGASFPKIRNDGGASGGKVTTNNFTTSQCKIFGVVAEQEDYILTVRYRSVAVTNTADARDIRVNEELPIKRFNAKITLPVTGGALKDAQLQIKLVPGEKNIVTIYSQFNQNQSVEFDYFVLEPGILPEPVAEWKTVDDSNSAILYSGGFAQNADNTAHEASNAGETAQFTFEGTGIRWYSNIVADYGSATIILDGVAVDTVNIPSAAFEGPDKQVLEITGLEEGLHTIEIVSQRAATITLTKLQYLGTKDVLVPPGPDVVVLDIKTIPENPKGGDAVLFVAVVKNIGTEPTPDGIITGVDFIGYGYHDTYSAAIQPGEVVELVQVTDPWIAPAGELVEVRAFVDNINRYGQAGVKEQSRDNNILKKTFFFGVPGEVSEDIVLTNPAASSSFDEGETILIQAAVSRNDISKVVFYAGADVLGEDTSAPYTFEWNPRGGTYALTAQATTASGTALRSESIPVTIIPGLPDLVVSDILWTPNALMANNQAKFSAIVTNQGVGSSPDNTITSVKFKVDGQLVTWSNAFIRSLSPGESATITAVAGSTGSAFWRVPSGNLGTVEAIVDAEDRIAEADEGNNARSEPLTNDGGGTFEPVNLTLEAEEAVISKGIVESNHPGYTGSGFVNYTNVVGSYVEWTVDVPTAGSYQLAFRYANGATVNRPCALRINGTVVNPGLAFNASGAWTNYSTANTLADLVAGENTIRATANLASGGPNMDHLNVTSASASARTGDQKTKPGIIEGSVETSVRVFPNPASHTFTMRYHSEQAGQGRVTITNLLSRQIKEIKIDLQAGKNELAVDTQDLASGVYLVHVVVGKERKILKLIIDN